VKRLLINLAAAYVAQAQPVVDEQIPKAGVRLAAALNLASSCFPRSMGSCYLSSPRPMMQKVFAEIGCMASK
jgi:hypothetical protein